MINRTIHNPALRGTITFLTTAKESHGAISELEVTVMPKGENPPHYHRSYDESFTVIEGMLRLHLGGGVGKDLGPGESYVVRAGNVHSFRNETNQPARVRARIVPGKEGFENSLRILAGLSADGLYNNRLQMPHSLQHLAICVSMSDTRLVGSSALLNQPLRLLAWFARKQGVENELLLRYCK
jgi:quercetin dioxygenase-like cupin family protein